MDVYIQAAVCSVYRPTKGDRLCLSTLPPSCIHLCSFSHAELPLVRALGLFFRDKFPRESCSVTLINSLTRTVISSPVQLLCSFVHGNIVLYLLSRAPPRSAEASISLLSCYVLSCYSLPFDIGLQLNFPCIDFPASTVLTTSVQSNWDCRAMTALPYTRQSTFKQNKLSFHSRSPPASPE